MRKSQLAALTAGFIRYIIHEPNIAYNAYSFFRQSFVPNGSHPQENSNPYASGAVPPIQTHGMAPQQALPPMN